MSKRGERKVRSQPGAEICIAKTKNIIYISVQEGNPRNRRENNRKRMTDYSNQSQKGIAKTKEEVERICRRLVALERPSRGDR